MEKNQSINIDSVINGLVSGIMELGNLMKMDKAKSNETIENLQEENTKLKKQIKEKDK